jgi:NitT/TauT family transport system substrate-binding protein
MRGKRVTRGRRTIAVVACAGLFSLAAACGDDDKTADGLTKVNVILGGDAMSWAPLYIGVEDGYFKDEGLEVTVTASEQGTAPALAAVVKGDALVTCSSLPAQVGAIREGAPVKIFMVLGVGVSAQVVASPDFLAEHDITDSTPVEDRIKAMEGAKIGGLAPGSGPDLLLAYMFSTVGLDLAKDASVTALGTFANQLAAMKNGKIDVFFAAAPAGAQAEAQGIGKIFIRPTEIDQLQGYPYSVCTLNSKSTTDSPDEVKDFVAATVRGLALMRDDPEAAKEVLLKKFPDFDATDFDALFQDAIDRVPDSLVFDEDEFDVAKAFGEAAGQPVDVDYDEAVSADLTSAGTDQYESKYK